MKIKSLFCFSAGAFLLASCGDKETAGGDSESGTPVMESSIVVPANDGVDRPLFNDAQKHLRFGGDYYAYTYVGDSYQGIADFVDDFIVEPLLKEPMAEEGISTDMRSLLDWSGLGGITAMGSSSHTVGEVYETRQVLVVDDPDRGLWKMMGEARPALSANVFAPDVSIAMDVQLDLRSARPWLDELKPMFGEEFAGMLDQGMNQGLGKKTVGEILDGFNARFAMGVVLHSDKKINIPLTEEEALELPDVDLIICAEGFTENFDELRSIISSQAQFEKVELPNGVTGYAVKAEEMPPMPVEGVRPVIAYDAENNRIFLCSRLSYLEETLSSGDKLKDNADYVAAMEGLPTDVMSTFYFSKQAGGEIDALITRVTEDNSKTLEEAVAAALTETEDDFPGLTSDKALELIKKLEGWRNRFLGNAWLSVSSRDGNAIYSVTRMPINTRPLLLGSSGYGSLMAVTTVGAMFTGFTQASGLAFGVGDFGGGAEKSVCVMNARNMQMAVRSWQNMENKAVGDPIDMSEIIGEDKFIAELPTCPSGGNYSFSDTIPEEGEACLKCSIYDHAPEDTEGW